jgi:hypothetical protein
MSDATGWRLDRIEKDLERLDRDLRTHPTLDAYRDRQEAINREFRDLKAKLDRLEADTGRKLDGLRIQVETLEDEWQKDVKAGLQSQLDTRKANTRWAVTTIVSIAALALTIISLVLRG